MSDPYTLYLEEQAAYGSTLYANEDWGEIHLNGKPYPVHDFVQYSNLATFQPKFTVGETSKDSDNIFSVWIQTDWTGGGQMAVLNNLSDVQRFRHATLETRFPYILTLPLLTTSFGSDVDEQAYPIGDYKPGVTNLFWCAFGNSLRYWDKDTQSFIGGDTLAAAPVNKGVVYSGALYIPQGDSGYDVWDGSSVVHGTDDTITPVSFLIWDDKLLALSTNGQVSTFDDLSMTWNSEPVLRLRGQRVPRNLVNWWDQQGNPTVYVVTDTDVWAVDPVVPTMYRTGLVFPSHPDQGRASATWRDDAMYVSVATGVHQLARGNVVSAMGLDHNDGLPLNLRGVIVDLEPEYNGMLALVQGMGTTTVGDDDGSDLALNEPRIFDDALVIPTGSSAAESTLQRWTGTGWHTVWQSTGATGNPTRVYVSQADGEYQMWWGYGNQCYRQPLRRTFYNPRAGAELGIDQFEQTGYLLTGRFDAGMASFYKSISHVEVHMDPSSTGTVEVYYQTDTNYPNWDRLGQATGQGSTMLYFDPDQDGFSEGLACKWIEFKYVFTSPDPSLTPIVMWITAKFVKVPLLSRSWSFQVPLDFPEQWQGRGAAEIADDLDQLAADGRFITFKHRTNTYRVRVSQTQGHDAVGRDLRGVRQINLIELGPADIHAETIFHTALEA